MRYLPSKYYVGDSCHVKISNGVFFHKNNYCMGMFVIKVLSGVFVIKFL